MPGHGLKDLCFALLSASAEGYLDLQWSDGRFAPRAEMPTDEWNFFDQQYLLPAALLYTADRPDNPWRESPRWWEAILRHGRHLVSRVGEDGAMEWRLNGVVLGSPFVCQRLTCAWLNAYQLLHDRLPAEEATRWREKILLACTWLWEHKVLPFRDVARFTSHQVQIGLQPQQPDRRDRRIPVQFAQPHSANSASPRNANWLVVQWKTCIVDAQIQRNPKECNTVLPILAGYSSQPGEPGLRFSSLLAAKSM